MSKSEKLLEKARRSKTGWRRSELDALYQSFGFVIESRRKHDIVYHEDYLTEGIRTTLPRSNKVNPVYVGEAVKLIERLIELRKNSGMDENNG